MTEDDIQKLEAQLPLMAATAFGEARSRALAAGLTLVEAHDGFLYEVRPNGRRRLLRAISANCDKDDAPE